MIEKLYFKNIIVADSTIQMFFMMRSAFKRNHKQIFHHYHKDQDKQIGGKTEIPCTFDLKVLLYCFSFVFSIFTGICLRFVESPRTTTFRHYYYSHIVQRRRASAHNH